MFGSAQHNSPRTTDFGVQHLPITVLVILSIGQASGAHLPIPVDAGRESMILPHGSVVLSFTTSKTLTDVRHLRLYQDLFRPMKSLIRRFVAMGGWSENPFVEALSQL